MGHFVENKPNKIGISWIRETKDFISVHSYSEVFKLLKSLGTLWQCQKTVKYQDFQISFTTYWWPRIYARKCRAYCLIPRIPTQNLHMCRVLWVKCSPCARPGHASLLLSFPARAKQTRRSKTRPCMFCKLAFWEMKKSTVWKTLGQRVVFRSQTLVVWSPVSSCPGGEGSFSGTLNRRKVECFASKLMSERLNMDKCVKCFKLAKILSRFYLDILSFPFRTFPLSLVKVWTVRS